MTEIKRSIEISADTKVVWSQISPKNWTKIFDFVREVNGYSNGEVGIGTQAKVVAGNDEQTAIKYNVEITEFKENEKIVYRRYGGPLPGQGILKLSPVPGGTLLTRIGQYDDNLSEEIMDALSEGIEKDNQKIKKIVEGK